MTTHIVYDAVQPTGSRTIDENGFLTGAAVLARSGILQYRADEVGVDGGSQLVNVYRPPVEIEQAIHLYDGKPMTVDHPPEMVTPRNAKTFAVGHVSYPETATDGRESLVKAKITITDQAAIDALNEGIDELSVGAGVTYDYTPGTAPCGTPYQAIQREIRPNHVAIVKRGRCGPVCRALDKLNGEDSEMPKVKIGDNEYEVDKAVADAFSKNQGEKAALESQLEKLKKKKSEDSAPAKADQKALDTMVAETLTALDVARDFIENYDHSNKTAHEIRCDVLDAAEVSVNKDNEIAVGAAFEVTRQLSAKNKAAFDSQREEVAKGFAVATDDDGQTEASRARAEWLNPND